MVPAPGGKRPVGGNPVTVIVSAFPITKAVDARHTLGGQLKTAVGFGIPANNRHYIAGVEAADFYPGRYRSLRYVIQGGLLTQINFLGGTIKCQRAFDLSRNPCRAADKSAGDTIARGIRRCGAAAVIKLPVADQIAVDIPGAPARAGVKRLDVRRAEGAVVDAGVVDDAVEFEPVPLVAPILRGDVELFNDDGTGPLNNVPSSRTPLI